MIRIIRYLSKVGNLNEPFLAVPLSYLGSTMHKLVFRMRILPFMLLHKEKGQ